MTARAGARLACYRTRPRPAAPRSAAADPRAERDELRAALDALRAELREHLPRLLQVCHPDRHGGSAASTTATAWLLDLRRRLGGDK